MKRVFWAISESGLDRWKSAAGKLAEDSDRSKSILLLAFSLSNGLNGFNHK